MNTIKPIENFTLFDWQEARDELFISSLDPLITKEQRSEIFMRVDYAATRMRRIFREIDILNKSVDGDDLRVHDSWLEITE